MFVVEGGDEKLSTDVVTVQGVDGAGMDMREGDAKMRIRVLCVRQV